MRDFIHSLRERMSYHMQLRGKPIHRGDMYDHSNFDCDFCSGYIFVASGAR